MSLQEIWAELAQLAAGISHKIWVADLSPLVPILLGVVAFFVILVVPARASDRYATWFQTHPRCQVGVIIASACISIAIMAIMAK